MTKCVVNNNDYSASSYVNKLLQSLVEKNHKIWLNLEQIMSLTDENLRNMFVANDGKQFGEFVVYLKSKFHSIICPIFMNTWIMNDHAFEMVTRTTDQKYKNIEVAVQGPIIKCHLSDDKNIVFQPRLMKIENLFNVEMKLVSTHNNLPIKVHFDVNYKDSDRNYYTSLHPRMMDVRWNNKFHVALPAIKASNQSQGKSGDKMTICCGNQSEEKEPSETMSISMSVMIHNIDKFEINYEDLTTTNLIKIADMSSSAVSYTFPDIISTFYGISNSIVSILDSISDVLFVLFLWGFNEIQNHHDDRETNKI
eukprot:68998_1